MPEPSTPTFSGFHSPNYTMVPDQLFDELLVELTGAELKALLYITRRTFGFKRDSDAISLAQMLSGITTKDGRVLDRGVGLSKPSLLSALRSLIARNIIETERRRSAERGDEPTVYRLRFAAAEPKQRDVPPVVKKVYHPPVVKKVNHPVVKKVAPQYTVIQDTDISNIRKEGLREKELEAIYAETTIAPDEVPAKTKMGRGVIPTAPDNSKTAHTASPSGFTPISVTLGKRQQSIMGKGSAERDGILSRIEQFAQEFGDRATLKSSTSRAYNLFRRSGLSHEQFMHCLWEARAITRERVGDRGGQNIKAKMGYFFSVLAERLGLQDAPFSTEVSTARHGTVTF